MRNCGHKNDNINELAKEALSSCDVCVKFGRSEPKPVVSLPLSSGFNDVVALDLHQVTEMSNNCYYIHIIDLFTRYSAAKLIFDKTAETIVQTLNCIWIFVYGAPNTILSDNGREFDNELFRENAGFFNISVKSTAAYSPWSNGCCERHNMVLTETFLKTRYAVKNDELALQQALFAKNSLMNFSGFAPYQLVFGRLPNLPSVMTSKLPALESPTLDTVAKHLAGLSEARSAFVQAESSERVKRALRHNVRESNHELKNGQEVLYQRDNQWKGPGKIIGIDGKVVIIRHGGYICKVHTSKIRPTVDSREVRDSLDVDVSTEMPNEAPDRTERCDDSDNEELQVESPYDELQADNPYPVEKELNLGSQSSKTKEIALPKSNQLVNVFPKDWSEPLLAKILSRAGKTKGNNRYMMNVEYMDDEYAGQQVCLDFENDVSHWEPVEEIIMLTEYEEDEILKAKQKELDSWLENEVYEECANLGQQSIRTRWVTTHKDDGTPKCRLVARGFEDPDSENVLKDSPTCSKDTFRVILAVASSNVDWDHCTIDIKTAFFYKESL